MTIPALDGARRLDELSSEQHRVWPGQWPADDAGRARLMALLEREHFAGVSRYSLGAVRCRRSADRVECRLFGGPRLLAFVDAVGAVESTRVERVWRIAPGLLARVQPRGVPPLATLRIGVERRPDGLNHGWIGVAAFRSRFLAPVPAALRFVAPVWRAVGWLYATVHEQAAHSALRALARSRELGPAR